MKKRTRVLFVSGELIAADLAYRLKQEGCNVRLFIEDESRKDCFENMVEKTDDWKKELDWVGKDGLIVFDDVGYGKEQDDLRKEGYLVVGGSEGGDKLERDRSFSQEIFGILQMDVVSSTDFHDYDSAIKFVKHNTGPWVIKQDSHLSSLAYVGQLESGKDTIEVLESYKKFIKRGKLKCISIQKKVDGVEMAVGRFFNGKSWVGPMLVNFEHKPLFNENIGPLTGEMGTLAWYDESPSNKLFARTLGRIEGFLRQSNFKGYIDINCIVTSDRAVPLEATARFGCPTCQLQSELHISSWHSILEALAKGEEYKVEYKRKIGIVVSVAIPPFPYKSITNDDYLKGVDILFRGQLTKKELNQLHFEEVSLCRSGKRDHFCISGSNGYILYVTGCGESAKEARKDAYSLIDKLVIPKMFYRTDIGLKFIDKDQEKLKKWGWI